MGNFLQAWWELLKFFWSSVLLKFFAVVKILKWVMFYSNGGKFFWSSLRIPRTNNVMDNAKFQYFGSFGKELILLTSGDIHGIAYICLLEDEWRSLRLILMYTWNEVPTQEFFLLFFFPFFFMISFDLRIGVVYMKVFFLFLIIIYYLVPSLRYFLRFCKIFLSQVYVPRVPILIGGKN